LISHRPLRLALTLLVCALATAASSAPAAAVSSRQVAIGSAPLRPAGSKVLGALPAAAPLRVTVALAPRDPLALEAYALAVSTPGSSSYHQYLSVARFADRFGPTVDQIAAVSAALRAQGLHPGAVSANRLSIPVTAGSGTLGRAFSTSFDRVTVTGGRVAFVNTSAPLLDHTVAGDVQAIIGLSDIAHPQPQLSSIRRADGAVGSAASRPNVATGGPQPCQTASTAAASLPITYTADQIASAYGFSGLYGAGNEGAGQTIALYELEPNFPSDVSAYQACYGTSASVSYVSVDGGPNPAIANADNGDGVETELDIDSVIGIAPKATVLVYQGPNSDSGAPGAGPYDTYDAIISQDRANVISTSWGACEPIEGMTDARAESTLFEEAAIQGETVVAAAGDSGAEDCNQQDSSTAAAVDDPASQPFVTGVGGTSLTIGPPRNETVWNLGPALGAGGGGVSSLWAMPSYQANASPSLHVINSSSSATPCGAASGACREVPDVSSDANEFTGYLVYWAGDGSPTDLFGWGGVGGTSAGAPTWAALIALANDTTACAGAPIGFANPALYRAAGSAYASDFNDVISGNNDMTSTNGGKFAAAPGYDMASGLGTPVASTLAPELCNETLRLANPGPQASVVGASVSKPFTATDGAGAAVSYAAGSLPPGLSINAATGMIAGRPTTAGAYAVTIFAKDSDGLVSHATFGWLIEPAVVTVATPAAQLSRVGAAAKLAIHASSNNGGTLGYSATGLPRGLSINRSTGVISGKPTGTRRTSVTVTVADGSVSTKVVFVWTISGLPRPSGTSLSGIGRGQATLVFTLTAGTNEPALKKLTVALPQGLTLSSNSRLVRGRISVRAPDGARLRFRLGTSASKLTIKLASAAASVRVVISSPAIVASGTLIGSVSTGQSGRLDVTVRATDTSGATTRLPLRLRPS
jgi:hypothetical protein